jgi:hypothetical protein
MFKVYQQGGLTPRLLSKVPAGTYFLIDDKLYTAPREQGLGAYRAVREIGTARTAILDANLWVTPVKIELIENLCFLKNLEVGQWFRFKDDWDKRPYVKLDQDCRCTPFDTGELRIEKENPDCVVIPTHIEVVATRLQTGTVTVNGQTIKFSGEVKVEYD